MSNSTQLTALHISERLKDKGLVLPAASAPAANYAPFTLAAPFGFISGQLPKENDNVAVKGHLGADVSTDRGKEAAQLCALNCLAQIHAALEGNWERFGKLVRICGYVASTPTFTEQPIVINGASDLLVHVLGDAGIHARAAIGVSALPLGAAVEVEASFTFS